MIKNAIFGIKHPTPTEHIQPYLQQKLYTTDQIKLAVSDAFLEWEKRKEISVDGLNEQIIKSLKEEHIQPTKK